MPGLRQSEAYWLVARRLEGDVTTFRPDTSFPYLKIAREYGVPYGEVIRMVENIECSPEYRYLVNWERSVVAAWMEEASRRRRIEWLAGEDDRRRAEAEVYR